MNQTPPRRVVGPGPARREFLRRAALALLGTALPAGCGDAGPVCGDPELLSTPERELRRAQGYREVSPHGAARSCAGCQFFEPGDGACGRCRILGGPVSRAGHCSAWAATS